MVAPGAVARSSWGLQQPPKALPTCCRAHRSGDAVVLRIAMSSFRGLVLLVAALLSLAGRTPAAHQESHLEAEINRLYEAVRNERLSLERRLDATARIASLVANEKYCKTGEAVGPSCSILEKGTDKIHTLQDWASKSEGWERSLASISLFRVGRSFWQQENYDRSLLAVEQSIALKLFPYQGPEVLETWQRSLMHPKGGFDRQRQELADALVLQADCLLEMGQGDRNVAQLEKAMQALQLGAALVHNNPEAAPDTYTHMTVMALQIASAAVDVLNRLRISHIHELMDTHGVTCKGCTDKGSLLRQLVPRLNLPVVMLSATDPLISPLEDPLAMNSLPTLRRPKETQQQYMQRQFGSLLGMVHNHLLEELQAECARRTPEGFCASYRPRWTWDGPGGESSATSASGAQASCPETAVTHEGGCECVVDACLGSGSDWVKNADAAGKALQPQIPGTANDSDRAAQSHNNACHSTGLPCMADPEPHSTWTQSAASGDSETVHVDGGHIFNGGQGSDQAGGKQAAGGAGHSRSAQGMGAGHHTAEVGGADPGGGASDPRARYFHDTVRETLDRQLREQLAKKADAASQHDDPLVLLTLLACILACLGLYLYIKHKRRISRFLQSHRGWLSGSTSTSTSSSDGTHGASAPLVQSRKAAAALLREALAAGDAAKVQAALDAAADVGLEPAPALLQRAQTLLQQKKRRERSQQHNAKVPAVKKDKRIQKRPPSETDCSTLPSLPNGKEPGTTSEDSSPPTPPQAQPEPRPRGWGWGLLWRSDSGDKKPDCLANHAERATEASTPCPGSQQAPASEQRLNQPPPGDPGASAVRSSSQASAASTADRQDSMEKYEGIGRAEGASADNPTIRDDGGGRTNGLGQASSLGRSAGISMYAKADSAGNADSIGKANNVGRVRSKADGVSANDGLYRTDTSTGRGGDTGKLGGKETQRQASARQANHSSNAAAAAACLADGKQRAHTTAVQSGLDIVQAGMHVLADPSTMAASCAGKAGITFCHSQASSAGAATATTGGKAGLGASISTVASFEQPPASGSKAYPPSMPIPTPVLQSPEVVAPLPWAPARVGSTTGTVAVKPQATNVHPQQAPGTAKAEQAKKEIGKRGGKEAKATGKAETVRQGTSHSTARPLSAAAVVAGSAGKSGKDAAAALAGSPVQAPSTPPAIDGANPVPAVAVTTHTSAGQHAERHNPLLPHSTLPTLTTPLATFAAGNASVSSSTPGPASGMSTAAPAPITGAGSNAAAAKPGGMGAGAAAQAGAAGHVKTSAQPAQPVHKAGEQPSSTEMATASWGAGSSVSAPQVVVPASVGEPGSTGADAARKAGSQAATGLDSRAAPWVPNSSTSIASSNGDVTQPIPPVLYSQVLSGQGSMAVPPGSNITSSTVTPTGSLNSQRLANGWEVPTSQLQAEVEQASEEADMEGEEQLQRERQLQDWALSTLAGEDSPPAQDIWSTGSFAGMQGTVLPTSTNVNSLTLSGNMPLSSIWAPAETSIHMSQVSHPGLVAAATSSATAMSQSFSSPIHNNPPMSQAMYLAQQQHLNSIHSSPDSRLSLATQLPDALSPLQPGTPTSALRICATDGTISMASISPPMPPHTTMAVSAAMYGSQAMPMAGNSVLHGSGLTGVPAGYGSGVVTSGGMSAGLGSGMSTARTLMFQEQAAQAAGSVSWATDPMAALRHTDTMHWSHPLARTGTNTAAHMTTGSAWATSTTPGQAPVPQGGPCLALSNGAGSIAWMEQPTATAAAVSWAMSDAANGTTLPLSLPFVAEELQVASGCESKLPTAMRSGLPAASSVWDPMASFEGGDDAWNPGSLHGWLHSTPSGGAGAAQLPGNSSNLVPAGLGQPTGVEQSRSGNAAHLAAASEDVLGSSMPEGDAQEWEKNIQNMLSFME